MTLLPQDCTLSPYMSVREILVYLARLQGPSRDDARRDARQVLSVDLADRAEERVQQLSHGMRRRVATAQAFLGDPAIIDLDEPTQASTPTRWCDCATCSAASAASARSSSAQPHSLRLEATCDHVIFMENGRCTTRDRSTR